MTAPAPAPARPGPVLVDTSRSRQARLRPVPVGATRLADGVWAPRVERNRTVALPTMERLLEETGRLDNLRRAAGELGGDFAGMFFNDSDVHKWLEAASWSLATVPDPALAARMDAVIALLGRAQRPDGYLNSYFSGPRADERWTDVDLHELYCGGHLIQAAVAHARVTGSDALLRVATRFADHVCDTFGPEEGQRLWADGHQEAELAFVELFRQTGDRRYLDEARFFVDVRGHRRFGTPYGTYGPEYHQDHVPLREMTALAGHAVRAMYYLAGAADIVLETGEVALRQALDRLWEDTRARRSYVTGGVGSRWHGEAFGGDWELPSATAYTETCAAIGSVMWNWRMLLATGEARFADVIEHALLNAVLPGWGLDGETYFYQNPLFDDGGHRRERWFRVACCPPNVARTVAAITGYLHAVDDDGVWVHLYATGDSAIPLPDGRLVRLRQRTGYPWDGEVEIMTETAGRYALRLRVPGWCRDASLTVNGADAGVPLEPGTYARLDRDWRPGDRVVLNLPMPVRRLTSHPRITENRGQVALMRGPVLYCLEGVDHPGVDLRDIRLPDDAPLAATARPDLLGGCVTLTGEALVAEPGPVWQGEAYLPADDLVDPPPPRPIRLTAIPYHLWANRAAGQMAVWIRVSGAGSLVSGAGI